MSILSGDYQFMCGFIFLVIGVYSSENGIINEFKKENSFNEFVSAFLMSQLCLSGNEGVNVISE